MKKALIIVLCFCMMLSLCSCGGYPDKTQECPSNWPTYRAGSLTFQAEAGWGTGDAATFNEYTKVPYAAIGTTNQMKWLAFLQSQQDVNKKSNYLTVSYLDYDGEVTDKVLEEQAEQLQNVKMTFEKAGASVFMQTFPEVGKYGENNAVYFSGKFTLDNDISVVVQFALIGEGTRLYQFAYYDYTDPAADNGQLAMIISSLKWGE